MVLVQVSREIFCSNDLRRGTLFYFFKFIYFIYLFLAALDFHCCVRAFSSCSEQGLPFCCSVQASLVTEHGL